MLLSRGSSPAGRGRGIENRDSFGVEALGIDEIHLGKKDKYWTLVYQIIRGQ